MNKTSAFTKTSAPKARAAKATVIDATILNETANERHASTAAEMDDDTLYAKGMEFIDEMQRRAGATSVWRIVSAFMLSLVAAAGIGAIMGHVISIAMVGSLLVTGSAVLATIIWFIGIVISMILGYFASKFTFDYVATAKIDAHVSSAKSWVTGLFGRGAKPSADKPMPA